MPLTAEQKAAYGPDWKAASLAVRERSGGRCECRGECGWEPHVEDMHPVFDGDPEDLVEIALRCRARNGEPSPYTGSKVVLTAAHLDRNGHEGVNDLERLKAMCQGCHLAYDRKGRA